MLFSSVHSILHDVFMNGLSNDRIVAGSVCMISVDCQFLHEARKTGQQDEGAKQLTTSLTQNHRRSTYNQRGFVHRTITP
jgi:hypothetical protein